MKCLNEPIKKYIKLLKKEEKDKSISVKHLCKIIGAEYNPDVTETPKETLCLSTPSMVEFSNVLPKLSRLLKAEGSKKKIAWYFYMDNGEILKVNVLGFFKQWFHHILWRAFVEFEKIHSVTLH